MPTTVDQLITKYTLVDDYSPRTRAIVASSRSAGTAMNHAKGSAAGLSTGFSKLAGAASLLLGPIRYVSTAIAGIAAAGLGAGIWASKAAADLEAMKLGLTAVAGSAEEAERQIKRLAIVAALPGLGYTQAIEGSTRLQAGGMDSRLAERTLISFGNALATVGKGRAELDGVIMALTQIAAKGKVSAEEINQLAERLPQIRQVMQQAFGTSSTEALDKMGVSAEEFITKVIAGLERLPRAAGGFKNSLENLSDVFFVASATFGQSLNNSLLPILEKAGSFISFLVDSGVIDKLGQSFASLLGGGDGTGIARLLAYTTATLESLPQIISAIGHSLQGVVTWMIDNLNKLIDAYNAMVDNPIARQLGFEKMVKLGIGAGLPSMAAFRDLIDSRITPRANELMSQFGGYSPNNTLGGGEGSFRSQAATAATQTTLLGEIAHNTAQMVVDFKRNVLGGGDIGRAGVTPVEMRSVRGGGSADSLVEQGAQLIMRAISMKAGQSALNARRMGV